MLKPRVFVDADVIFAGSASPSTHGASYIVLRMAELTLVECITSEQAITEAERNLAEKLPDKLPAFRLLVHRCLRVVPDPAPADLAAYAGQANLQDLPILVAALREKCSYLLTFNVRHFTPAGGQIAVQTPGDFLLTVRNWLSMLVTSNLRSDQPE
jgi:hypothetical protein